MSGWHPQRCAGTRKEGRQHWMWHVLWPSFTSCPLPTWTSSLRWVGAAASEAVGLWQRSLACALKHHFVSVLLDATSLLLGTAECASGRHPRQRWQRRGCQAGRCGAGSYAGPRQHGVR